MVSRDAAGRPWEPKGGMYTLYKRRQTWVVFQEVGMVEVNFEERIKIKEVKRE